MQTVLLGGKIAAGRVALVDDEDYDLVAKYHWYAVRRRHNLYAAAHVPGTGKRGITVHMHWVILGTKGIDHINHNGLDNQRSNLRVATQSQNLANQGLRSDNSSGFKGVVWITGASRWRAYITVGQQLRWLGHFTSAEAAARAYDAAALAAWGEYAWLNFPD